MLDFHELSLAEGSRGFVIIDRSGATHSLNRILAAAARRAGADRITAAIVRKRLDKTKFPSVEELRNGRDATRESTESGEAIFFEARCARQTSQELLPLLKLLQNEDSETQSPLDEIKSLLTAIVEILGHQNTILKRLDVGSGNVPRSSSLKLSTFPD